jgi:hypothetical protein
MGFISFGISYQLRDYIPNKDAAGMLLDLHIQSKFQWENINLGQQITNIPTR